MARKPRRNILTEQDHTDFTSMIDVVFLLLIYFMVTTALIKEEADLGIRLPANVPPSQDEDPPQEQIVEIQPSGQVLLNGAVMDHTQSRGMPELTRTLERLKAANDRGGLKTSVTIVADPDSLHQRSMDVLNACGSADIRLVMFAAD